MSDEIDKLKDAWNKVIDSQNLKISELEASSASHTEWIEGQKKYNRATGETIDELEKEFNIWKTEDYTEAENKKEIGELREFNERSKNNIADLKDFRHDVAMPRIITIEEVLRELTERHNEELLPGEKLELLEKLDVGSASARESLDRQTDRLTREEFYKKYDNPYAKAEKKEPREDYSCRLCGNEITDVEHEVNKLTIEVKREDLIRWKKYMGFGQYITRGKYETEYIEEEYGIK